MNRRLSESPNRRSPMAPADHWQSRSAMSSGVDNQTVRPFGPPIPSMPFPQLGPNVGNQRFFTPRSSYFGSANHVFNPSTAPNPMFNPSSAPNASQAFNYGNYGNNESIRPNPDLIFNTNRPVYSTPDPMSLSRIYDNMDVEDINQLKNALLNRNRESDQPKSGSPESTVHFSDSSPNKMNELIVKMKALTEEDNHKKKTRKDVEKKINELDEELKAFEKKIILRDRLKTIKTELESDEEKLGLKMKTLLNEMENCNKREQMSSKSDSDLDSNPKESVVTKTHPIPSQSKPESNVFKSALKRSNTLSSQMSSAKKVKIVTEKIQFRDNTHKEMRKSVQTFDNLKRTPKPNPMSPKVNRLCRQQTPFANRGTSGVRTSRPVRPSSSRVNRLLDRKGSDDSSDQLITDSSSASTSSSSTQLRPKAFDSTKTTPLKERLIFEKQKISNKINELKTIEKPLSESDDGVFEALKNIDSNVETMNESNPEISQSSDVQMNTNCDPNEDIFEDVLNELIAKDIEKDSVVKDFATNQSKEIDIVITIDSDDEDYVAEPFESIRIKTEKVDDTEDPGLRTERETNFEKNVNSKTVESSSFSDASEEHNTSSAIDDNVFKTPIAPTVNAISKFQSQYYRTNAEYEQTVDYSIGSFKAIAGPKSKTSQTSVISMKSFKDYLFVAFIDCSVRRYHINDKNLMVKLEGHEGTVLSMIIAQHIDSEDTYILYTSGKDKKLRAFDAMTCRLLMTIDLKYEIYCLDFNWSHVFCGLNNGTVCKVLPSFEDNKTEQNIIKEFVVNQNKRISSIISVQVLSQLDSSVEPLITVSSNKIQIINTSDSVKDGDRVLYSFGGSFADPIFCRAFDKYLFISYKCRTFKNEDKNSSKEHKSKVLIYNMQKDWSPLRIIDVSGVIHGLDLNKDNLIIASFDGKIQCIDCSKLELKWITFSPKVMAFSLIGNRLVLGNDEGTIDVIYLDQQMVDCETCGVTFARHKDYKEHIKLEHIVEDTKLSGEEDLNK